MKYTTLKLTDNEMIELLELLEEAKVSFAIKGADYLLAAGKNIGNASEYEKNLDLNKHMIEQYEQAAKIHSKLQNKFIG